MRASPRGPDRASLDDERRRRAAAEAESERLAAELQAAHDAVRARDALLAIVTHDLGNPLTAIVMSASAIPREDAQAARGADVILRCTERMARLLDDLATVASTGLLPATPSAGDGPGPALRMARTDPTVVVRDTAEMFEAIASERGLRFSTVVDEGVPHALLCDRERIVQAVGNLVANAVKVTKRGGSVTLGASASRDEVTFWVDDTGPGIDSQDLSRIFDRHWRGKNVSYGGRGLGLWIARAIADAHGGRLAVDSEPRRGSRFMLALPR
jgi:signal transduction histidine kinase